MIEPHVEAGFLARLGRPGGAPIGRLVPIEDIDPNPNQPRQSVGDLSELVASVREKGVLEPILVRPSGKRFEIIAGERRYRAAMEAGLAELPCVVREASDAETMEIALIENLQRKDLHAFEEADGLKVLAESYGYTHEKMAQKLSKSRTSVTETLSLTNMPEDVRELCRLADIQSKSLLLQVVRQSSPEKMVELIERFQREGLTTRQQVRTALKPVKKGAPGRPRNFVFKYQPKEKTFSLALQFKRTEVPRDEVVRALQSIIDELLRENA